MVRFWAGSPPGWLTVQGSTLVDASLKLGPGETEAILLAQELQANLILIDERKGYKAALARGLKVVSTLSILEEAGSRRLIDFEPVINILDKETTFHVTEEVLEDSRKRLKERRVSDA